jgi:HEAT repeat protein
MPQIDVTAMQRRRDVEGLIRALDDPSETVRTAAATALGTVGDSRAIEPLKHAKFFDESPGVRRAASAAHTRLAERLQAEQILKNSKYAPE